MFFETTKAKMIWRDTRKTRYQTKIAILNISTISICEVADTQHSAGKLSSFRAEGSLDESLVPNKSGIDPRRKVLLAPL
jgi:hypothetical protein